VNENGISLAPFYDLVNIRMYPEFDHEMAMAIGDEFNADEINAYQLADFAESCNIPRRILVKQMGSIIKKSLEFISNNSIYEGQAVSKKKYLSEYNHFVKKRCEHLFGEIELITKIEL